jgi:hypothetical protein
VLCCEAPQYGSAKSVANIAGMVAANVLRGDHPLVHWDTVDWEAIRADDNALIVDVREVSRWALRGCVYPRGGGRSMFRLFCRACGQEMQCRHHCTHHGLVGSEQYALGEGKSCS